MCLRDLANSRTFINFNYLKQWYLNLHRVKYPTNIKFMVCIFVKTDIINCHSDMFKNLYEQN